MAKEPTRDELNQKATDLGVENPESYGTKAELQEAIDQAENTSADENAPVSGERGGENDTTQEAIDDAVETAEENTESEQDEDVVTGAERDGTAELERPQDAAEARSEAIQAGREAARENVAKERAEQPEA